ncbi:PREDICTED: uncharacterized protein LOC105139689 isoform X1 [Populus euphratica]|uniref:Uncharacterized protein LOC105139689 isoform X1 n=1 Tax=Populus euphratica TaxID=75702 RepID=A0AAJ6VBS1_POPEU|nr:PREDICTED: uncharacterized protein LOC105139689 isoform X1 [Populus euphratica]
MDPINKARDHWAFLEEIEAPIWVDFLVEAKSNYQDVDDEWFRTSHPFHQCSSSQLKAASAYSGENSTSSDFECSGSFSPNIPSSVSRSRGKHYARKKWGGGGHDISMNKQHPVKVLSKSSRVNSEPKDKIKPKLSLVNSKGTSRSKASVVSGKSFTRNAKETDLEAKSCQGGTESSLNSLEVKAAESNTRTVTSERDHQAKQRNLEVSSRVNSEPNDKIKPKLSLVNSEGTSRSKASVVSGKSFTRNAKETDLEAKSCQGGTESSLNSLEVKAAESNTGTVTSKRDHQAKQRNLEVSSRGFDHASGLLSAVRNGLRKSFVTRKASRVEINDENKQLRDRKSSSSKSSWGSSSNPRYDAKSSTLGFKEQTPDSRNVARMTEAARKKTKDSDTSKASVFRVKEVFNYRKGGISNVAKSASLGALKSKVQNQTLRVKALADHRGNELHPLHGTAKAKEKVRVGGNNKLVGPGKENVTGKASLSLNCSSRGTKLNVPQKGDKTLLVRQKGKTSSPTKGRHSANLSQRRHLR